MWQRIYERCGVDPVYLLTVRHPANVVKSLVDNYKWGGGSANCFGLCDPLNRFDIREPTFTSRITSAGSPTMEQARGILHYTGIQWNKSEAELRETLEAQIKPELNRAVKELPEIKNRDVLLLYDALKEIRGSSFDRNALVGLADECSERHRWRKPRVSSG